MNANELAVELEHYLKGEEYDRLVWEIPNLLRQQQAEIEALKQIIDANNLSQNIGQFVKPANKPVAWMFQGAFDISTYVSFEKPNPDIYPNPTPLYTHPAKELTDEEIKFEAKYFCHSYHSENPERLVLFARAILRKAQEK
jgi:hypothetical protein